MDVTRENFSDVYPQVKAAVMSESCCFVAIDTEFTGLSTQEEGEKFTDTLDERYSKLRDVGSNYLITQFGLSAVQYDQTLDTHSIKTWNFYLFPRPFGSIDKRFVCQASSLDFLSMNGFDFNKFIGKGISYLSLKDQTLLEQKMKREIENMKKPSPSRITLSKQADILLMAEIKKKITLWLETTPTSEDQLTLPCRNSFQRLLVYNVISKEFKNLYAEISGNHTMSIRQLSPLKARKRLEERISQKHKEFEDAVGFSKVIQLLSQSKKPVVGHNALLDFIYIYSHFYEQLPNSLDEFKQGLNKLLPRIYDTKYILSSTKLAESFASTSLGNAYNEITQRLGPSVVESFHAQEFERYKDAAAHEAGYDAYMTAVLFLGILPSASNHWVIGDVVKPLFNDNIQHMKELENRLYLLKSDAPYLDIGLIGQKIDRKNVYRIETSGKISNLDLDEIFGNAGIERKISDSLNSAFIFLGNELTSSAMKEIQGKVQNLRIISFDSWKAEQENCKQEDPKQEDSKLAVVEQVTAAEQPSAVVSDGRDSRLSCAIS